MWKIRSMGRSQKAHPSTGLSESPDNIPPQIPEVAEKRIALEPGSKGQRADSSVMIAGWVCCC